MRAWSGYDLAMSRIWLVPGSDLARTWLGSSALFRLLRKVRDAVARRGENWHRLRNSALPTPPRPPRLCCFSHGVTGQYCE
eukprot:scaffold16705_cov74-Isochrysis_galbana.AAC.1